jgi:hypothetical protein
MMPNEAPTWMDTSCTFVLIPKYFPKPIEIFKRFEGKCLLCFAVWAVVAVLSLHPGGESLSVHVGVDGVVSHVHFSSYSGGEDR